MDLQAFHEALLRCETIVEYAPYGSHKKVYESQGFQGRYVVLNPLDAEGAEFEDIARIIEPGSRWAFVSLGDLGTAPAWVCETLASVVRTASVFLLTFSDTYKSRDNRAFFEAWRQKLPAHIEWTDSAPAAGETMLRGLQQ